ncbi:MAG TPA: chorismate mutase [Actinomycetota bacterium]|nr:chorismate mutase [Actinomycetota bacterium]
MSRVYAVRGATTIDADSREDVVSGTQTLLRELLDRNDLAPDDLVSIVFTATDDIHAEFPAAAARLMGLDVPLLCARELDVTSSLAVPRCIRVLVHCYAERRPQPVYLNDASRLLDPPDPA